MSLLKFNLFSASLLKNYCLCWSYFAHWRCIVGPYARQAHCTLKGQEEITIQGMGLVIGLNGTVMERPMRRRYGACGDVGAVNTPLGEKGLAELKDAKNVALVMVTATIPASGARQAINWNV